MGFFTFCHCNLEGTDSQRNMKDIEHAVKWIMDIKSTDVGSHYNKDNNEPYPC